MSLDLPVVGGDRNTWGTKVNAALTDLETRKVESAAAGGTAKGAVLAGSSGSGNGATVVPRDTVTTFSAINQRSSAVNQPTAVDVSPNGTGYSPANGYAWFDAVDADCQTGEPVMNVGRLFAQNDHVGVGGFAYNGATPKPFWIRVGTDGTGNSAVASKWASATGGVAGADDYTLTVDPFVILAAHGGSVVAASGYRLKTAATLGFFYVPNINGTPTGTPSAYGQTTALAFDQAASKLWARVGGTWKSVTFA